jgi:hypothetical protein
LKIRTPLSHLSKNTHFTTAAQSLFTHRLHGTCMRHCSGKCQNFFLRDPMRLSIASPSDFSYNHWVFGYQFYHNREPRHSNDSCEFDSSQYFADHSHTQPSERFLQWFEFY